MGKKLREAVCKGYVIDTLGNMVRVKKSQNYGTPSVKYLFLIRHATRLIIDVYNKTESNNFYKYKKKIVYDS